MRLSNEQYTMHVDAESLPPVGETLRLYGEDGHFVGVPSPEYYADGDGAYVLRRTAEDKYTEVAGYERLTYTVHSELITDEPCRPHRLMCGESRRS